MGTSNVGAGGWGCGLVRQPSPPPRNQASYLGPKKFRATPTHRVGVVCGGSQGPKNR